MAGKPWSQERRARQRETTRAQMACPARRELQAAVMRKMRKNPDHEKARQRANYSEPRRKAQGERLKKVRADPATEKKRKERARKQVTAMNARKRGGEIPVGYEALYFKLRKTHKIPAAESLRIVRAQRGADIRSS